MKIFVLILAEIGHINPVAGIVKELIRNENCQVVFYGRNKHRDMIELTGAKFRAYKHYQDGDACLKHLKEDPYTNDIPLFTNLINLSYNEIPELIKDIETDQPELIIFDQLSMPAKYLLKVMKNNFLNKKSSFPAPASVQIFTTFPDMYQIFPEKSDYKNLLIEPKGLYYNFQKIILKIKQRIFSYHFSIDCSNPYELCENFDSKLNIVTFISEIQPYRELLDSSFEFVGTCAPEINGKEPILDPSLKKILDLIEPVNPNYGNKETKFKLIYVSLGTVFNNNIFMFDCIIDTIKVLNHCESKLKVVIAVGDDNFDIYQKRMSQVNEIPENILILAFVPQIELLKRANLFITHCGMNSSSEAIHYAVPIVAIPIKADQPIVAHRMCNDLKLGILIKALDITSNGLKDAILRVLSDNSFSNNIKEMAKISRRYNGSLKAAQLIIDFINSK
uniref:UDP-glucuronosyltransferase n=1 Tax=Brachionus rotundiformis TaxID=96890 RepID=A0A7H9SPH4_9BILA|nr:UDP-glucuronosyltransferase-like protein 7 [Brachionus rotundiformis]